MAENASRNGMAFEYAVARAIALNHGLQWVGEMKDKARARLAAYRKVPYQLQGQMDSAALRIANSWFIREKLFNRHGLKADADRRKCKVMVGDDAKNGDVRDITILRENDTIVDGISLKWSSPEIKCIRFGPNWGVSRYGWQLSREWHEAVGKWQNSMEGFETYSEAIKRFGQFEVYGRLTRLIGDEFRRMVEADPLMSQRIASDIFGNQDYLKIVSEKQGEIIKGAVYIHRADKGYLVLTEERNRYLMFRFGTDWNLQARLHNKDKALKIANMSVSWSVRSWGREPWHAIAPH